MKNKKLVTERDDRSLLGGGFSRRDIIADGIIECINAYIEEVNSMGWELEELSNIYGHLSMFTRISEDYLNKKYPND